MPKRRTKPQPPPWPADQVERRKVENLAHYARNARTHSPAQVDQLAASIQKFGWTMPILVDEGDEIIAGHGRVLAAQKLGIEDIPTLVARGWTDAQKRAYRIADNQLTLNAGWDMDLLRFEVGGLADLGFDLNLLGFPDGELDGILAGSGEDGYAPTVIPEPPRNPVSRTGDLWLLGDHRLLCGDSTSPADVRRLMNGERATLFATDPPYLVDYDGSNHPKYGKEYSKSYGVTWDDASQGAELYDGFIRTAIDEAITEDAAWYCWHASRRQAMLEACWDKAGAFVHQQIIWAKDQGILTRSDYLWGHEPCFYGWLRGKRPRRIAKERLNTVWTLAKLYGDDRPDHPTPKPLECFAIPMRQHVPRGGVCYEPFSGSGSQIMAGQEVDRRVYAMEIGPAYVDVAVLRWQAETETDATLEGDGRTFAEIKAERLVVEGEKEST